VVYITHSLDEAILLGDRVILMTAHPGRLLSTFHIGIKRPRTIETMNSAEFGALRGEIWDQLGKEVTRAMEMQS
jgi:NitT/TauT family transport system ATP-binding protein